MRSDAAARCELGLSCLVIATLLVTQGLYNFEGRPEQGWVHLRGAGGEVVAAPEAGLLVANIFVGRQTLSVRDMPVTYFEGSDAFCELFHDGSFPNWTDTAVLVGESVDIDCGYATPNGLEAFPRLCATRGVIVLLAAKKQQLFHDGTFFQGAVQDCVIAEVYGAGARSALTSALSLGSRLTADVELLRFRVRVDWRQAFGSYVWALFELYHLVLRPVLILVWRFAQRCGDRNGKKASFSPVFVIPLVTITCVGLIGVVTKLRYPTLENGVPASVIYFDFTKFFGTSVGVDFISLSLYSQVTHAVSLKDRSLLSGQRGWLALGTVVIFCDFAFSAVIGRLAGINNAIPLVSVLFFFMQVVAISLLLRATRSASRALRSTTSELAAKSSSHHADDASRKILQLEGKLSFWIRVSALAAAMNMILFSILSVFAGDLLAVTSLYMFYHLSMFLTRIAQIKVFEPLGFSPSRWFELKRKTVEGNISERLSTKVVSTSLDFKQASE
jgi:hypothetical protein